jgi:uncharacterized protein (DUF2252 family)
MPRTLEERIISFNAGRYRPLLALKYQALAESPFRFFRGTAHLFWEDLAATVNWKDKTRVWTCGDLHLENFGSYRAANGQVYFDINDFDEAALAPASWELARFLVSLLAAADTWGITPREASDLGKVFLKAYSDAIKAGKAYAIEKETTSPLIRTFFEQVEKRTDRSLLAKRVMLKDLSIRKDDGRALDATAAWKKKISRVFKSTMAEIQPGVRVHDLAVRVAGTGSLGLRRFIVLARGNKVQELQLFDLKQAQASALAPHVPFHQPKWKNEAERIVTIQSIMNYALPPFLHVAGGSKASYVLRQLQPSADKFDHRLCKGKKELMAVLMREMALAVASAQLRSASRHGAQGVDELISLVEGSQWRGAVMKFSVQYHAQLIKDYRKYVKGYRKGIYKP